MIIRVCIQGDNDFVKYRTMMFGVLHSRSRFRLNIYSKNLDSLKIRDLAVFLHRIQLYVSHLQLMVGCRNGPASYQSQFGSGSEGRKTSLEIWLRSWITFTSNSRSRRARGAQRLNLRSGSVHWGVPKPLDL